MLGRHKHYSSPRGVLTRAASNPGFVDLWWPTPCCPGAGKKREKAGEEVEKGKDDDQERDIRNMTGVERGKSQEW